MKDNEKISGCLMLFILCGMGIFFAQTPLNTQYKIIIEPTLNPTRSVSQEIQLSGVTVQEAENNIEQLEADIASSQGRAAEDVEITSITSSGARRFRKLLAQGILIDYIVKLTEENYEEAENIMNSKSYAQDLATKIAVTLEKEPELLAIQVFQPKEECLMNFFRNNSKCVECPITSFSEQGDATECTPCGSNSKRSSSQSDCDSCVDDYYIIASTCVACPSEATSTNGERCDCPNNKTYTDYSETCNTCLPGFRRFLSECSKCPTDDCICPDNRNFTLHSTTCDKCIDNYELQSGSCVECPENSYSHGIECLCDENFFKKDNICVQCPPNSFSTGGLITECLCPPEIRPDIGFYYKNGTECIPCPADATSEGGLSETCECPGGAEFIDGYCGCGINTFYENQLCKPCNIDQYAPMESTQCTACPTNKQRDPSANSIECSFCKPDFYGPNCEKACPSDATNPEAAIGSLSSCTCTQSDQTHNPSTNLCECPLNHKKNSDGTCEACDIDEYAPAGSTSCTQCGANKQRANINSTDCSFCKPNFYGDCQACPSDATNPAAAIDSLSSCTCTQSDQTHNTQNDICECPANFYKDTTCKACPLQKISVEGGSCTDCESGRERSGPDSTTCDTCRIDHYRKDGDCIQCNTGDNATSTNSSSTACVCPDEFELHHPESNECHCSINHAKNPYIKVSSTCSAEGYNDLTTDQCQDLANSNIIASYPTYTGLTDEKCVLDGETYCLMTVNTCDPCPIDSTSDGDINATCTKCNDGAMRGTDTSGCTTCKPTYIKKDINHCVCAAGKESTDGVCTECPLHTVSGEGEACVECETSQVVQVNSGTPDLSLTEAECEAYAESIGVNYILSHFTGCDTCPQGCFAVNDQGINTKVYYYTDERDVECGKDGSDGKRLCIQKPRTTYYMTEMQCEEYANSLGYTYVSDQSSLDSNHGQCDYWASIGECKVNPGYMWSVCKRDCFSKGSPMGCVKRGNEVWYNVDTNTRECGYAGVECINVHKTCECTAGQYVAGSICVDCLKGHKCDGVSKTECDPGYQDETGQTECKTCDSCNAGSYETTACASVRNRLCSQCYQNHWQNETNQDYCKECATCGNGQEVKHVCTTTTDTVCEECSAGKFSDDEDICKSCASGQYQNNPGQSSCKPCVVANALTVTSIAPFNTANTCKATACNAGYALNNGVCEPCSPGTYESGGTCTECGIGKYGAPIVHTNIPDNSLTEADCLDLFNQENEEERYDCITQNCGGNPILGCSKYQHASNGKWVYWYGSEPGECPDGSTCFSKIRSDESTSCLSCPIGKYQSSTGKTSCDTCASRSETQKDGEFISTGATDCVQCAPGSFSLASSSTAYVRDKAGWIIDGSGVAKTSADACFQHCKDYDYFSYHEGGTPENCRCKDTKVAHSYGVTTADIYRVVVPHKCNLCSTGKWSSGNGQFLCTDCEAGKWSDELGANAESTCTNCDPGTYSTDTGAFSETSCISCVVDNAASVTSIAPFNTANTCKATACKEGYELDDEACKQCGRGKFSGGPNSVALYMQDKRCDDRADGTNRGSYLSNADGGSLTDCKQKCLDDDACKYYSYNSHNTYYCITHPSCDHVLDNTEYNAYVLTETCTSCLEGTYNNQEGQDTCTNKIHINGCPKGKGLYRGNNSQTIDDWVCKPCDNTTFGTEDTFNDDEDSTAECEYHKVWRDCPDTRQTCEILTCVIGHQLTGANAMEDAKCTRCPAGMASNLHAQDCTSCGGGTYNDGSEKADCEPCDSGKISRSVGHAWAFNGRCTVGKEIRVKYTPSDNNDENIESCKNACLERKPKIEGNTWEEIDELGMKSFVLPTAENKCYCQAYDTCNIGNDNDFKSYTFGATECTACEAGTYQDGNTCDNCPAGTYQSATGQSSCTKCAAGKFSATLGAIDESTCIDCPAGEESEQGASVCTKCPINTVSGEGEACRTYTDPIHVVEVDSGTPDLSLTEPECRAYAESIGANYDVGTYDDVGSGCFKNSGEMVVRYNNGVNTIECGATCGDNCDSRLCIQKPRTTYNLDGCDKYVYVGYFECTGGKEIRMYEGNGDNDCSGDGTDCTKECASACGFPMPRGSRKGSAYWSEIDSRGGVRGFIVGSTGRCYCETAVCESGNSGYSRYDIDCTTLGCKHGEYQFNSICLDCPAGSYCDGTTKTDCAAGFYSTTVGASSISTCIACPAGTYEDDNECTNCADGSETQVSNVFTSTGATQCTQCDAGTFSSASGYVLEKAGWILGAYDTRSINQIKTLSECFEYCKDYAYFSFHYYQGKQECRCHNSDSDKHAYNVDVSGLYRKVLPNKCEQCDVGKVSAAGEPECTYCPHIKINSWGQNIIHNKYNPIDASSVEECANKCDRLYFSYHTDSDGGYCRCADVNANDPDDDRDYGGGIYTHPMQVVEVDSGTPDLSLTRKECEALDLYEDFMSTDQHPSGCYQMNDKIYYNTMLDDNNKDCSEQYKCIQKRKTTYFDEQFGEDGYHCGDAPIGPTNGEPAVDCRQNCMDLTNCNYFSYIHNDETEPWCFLYETCTSWISISDKYKTYKMITESCGCTEGQYIAGSICVDCPAGSYCDGNTKTECAAGKFSATLGAIDESTCIDCPAGEGSFEGASTCTACPAGEVSNGGEACEACAAASYYTDTSGSSSVSKEECEAYAASIDKTFQDNEYDTEPIGCVTYGIPKIVQWNVGTSVNKCGEGSTFDRLCVHAIRPMQVVEVDSGTPDLSLTEEECEAYAESIGIPSNQYYGVTNNDIPSGCVKDSTEAYMYYNSDQNDKLCGAGDKLCIQKPRTTYYLTESGMPSDMTRDECEAYGKSFSPSKWYSADSWNNIPSGCFQNGAAEENDNVHYNEDANSIGCSANRNCVHKTCGCTEGQYRFGSICLDCLAGSYCDGNTKTECAAGKWSAASAHQCTECLAGKFSDTPGATDENACTDCAAGTTYSGAGADECTACTTCAAGSYQTTECVPDTNTVCTPCPEGRFCTGGTNNQECPAGKWSAASAHQCTECLAGKFSATLGAIDESTCTECPAGKFSATLGAIDESTCIDCPAGEESEQGASACTECPDGKVSGGGEVCTACAPGKFEEYNNKLCETCPEGSYQDQSGKQTCIPCADNKYSVAGSNDKTACVCPAGTYLKIETDWEAPEANSCPGDGYMDSGGWDGWSSDQCESACHANSDCNYFSYLYNDRCDFYKSCDGDGENIPYMYKVERVCTACESGKYQDETGQTSCKVCATEVSTNRDKCTTCPVGKYSENGCQSCPSGSFCDGNTKTDCPAGTYSATDESTCTECPIHQVSDAGASGCNVPGSEWFKKDGYCYEGDPNPSAGPYQGVKTVNGVVSYIGPGETVGVNNHPNKPNQGTTLNDCLVICSQNSWQFLIHCDTCDNNYEKKCYCGHTKQPCNNFAGGTPYESYETIACSAEVTTSGQGDLSLTEAECREYVSGNVEDCTENCDKPTGCSLFGNNGFYNPSTSTVTCSDVYKCVKKSKDNAKCGCTESQYRYGSICFDKNKTAYNVGYKLDWDGGECTTGSREIRMYKDSDDNPCTGDGTDCTQRCFEACRDRKTIHWWYSSNKGHTWEGFDLKSFVINPSSGACYCENSAISLGCENNADETSVKQYLISEYAIDSAEHATCDRYTLVDDTGYCKSTYDASSKTEYNIDLHKCADQCREDGNFIWRTDDDTGSCYCDATSPKSECNEWLDSVYKSYITKTFESCKPASCFHLIPGTEGWIFHDDYQSISASSKEECAHKCTTRYSSFAPGACRCAETLYKQEGESCDTDADCPGATSCIINPNPDLDNECEQTALQIGSYSTGTGTGIYEKRCLRAPNEAECKTTQLFDAIKSQISKTPYTSIQDSIGDNLVDLKYVGGCTFYVNTENTAENKLVWSEVTAVLGVQSATEKQYRVCMDWGKLKHIKTGYHCDNTQEGQAAIYSGNAGGEEACVQLCREWSENGEVCNYIAMHAGWCMLHEKCGSYKKTDSPYKIYKFETKYVLLDDPNKRCE